MPAPQSNRREFIRHPTRIPIFFTMEGEAGEQNEDLKDISCGGLSFTCGEELPAGRKVRLKIPYRNTFQTLQCRVVWSCPRGDRFETGVAFLAREDRFRARLVEQICHIEEYRRFLAGQGRELSPSEAAAEWIARYSNTFPW